MTTRFSGLSTPGRPRHRRADRRSSADRRYDGSDAVDCRGLLHDVGHGLATVGLLMDAARSTSPGSRERLLEMAEAETARLLATVRMGLLASRPGGPAEVAVRTVLEKIVELADFSRSTAVVMAAGTDAVASIDSVALWRVVSNLVDNAVRAAGPAGRVEVSLSEAAGGAVVIEVVDDGPGFRGGPSGVARIGLDVVGRLLAACGGHLEIGDEPGGGSRARVVLAAARSVPRGGDDVARRAV